MAENASWSAQHANLHISSVKTGPAVTSTYLQARRRMVAHKHLQTFYLQQILKIGKPVLTDAELQGVKGGLDWDQRSWVQISSKTGYTSCISLKEKHLCSAPPHQMKAHLSYTSTLKCFCIHTLPFYVRAWSYLCLTNCQLSHRNTECYGETWVVKDSITCWQKENKIYPNNWELL